MRAWIPEVALDTGERQVLCVLAAHAVSWRAIGGRLVATDRRILFQPNRVDGALGGRPWRVALDEVAAVDRKPRTFGLFDGGLRRRLRITTRDGAEHVFVVSGLDAVVAALAALLPA